MATKGHFNRTLTTCVNARHSNNTVKRTKMNLEKIFISQTIPAIQLDFYQLKKAHLQNYLGFSDNEFKNFFRHIILSKYQQSHRYYHNLSHILSFLHLSAHFDIQNRPAFEVAIWFHDIIYQPHFKNNEERSVHYFQKHCSENSNLSQEEKEWISQAIFSTFGHQPRIDGEMVKLFLDIDLAILATDWDTYTAYTKAIRKEYWIYPKPLYQNGRKKAMQHFLERDEIYFTEAFKGLERQARANIEREVKGLG